VYIHNYSDYTAIISGTFFARRPVTFSRENRFAGPTISFSCTRHDLQIDDGREIGIKISPTPGREQIWLQETYRFRRFCSSGASNKHGPGRDGPASSLAMSTIRKEPSMTKMCFRFHEGLVSPWVPIFILIRSFLMRIGRNRCQRRRRLNGFGVPV
jgi:hypothetical protein